MLSSTRTDLATNPAGSGVLISTTVKAVLVAVVSLGLIDLNEEQVTNIVLAIVAVVDLGIYFGLVKPRLKAQDEGPDTPFERPRQDTP